MRWLRGSRIVGWLVWAAAIALALATAGRLAGVGAGFWPVAPLTAFSLYLVVALLVGVAIALLLGRRAPAAVLVVATAALAIAVLPRTQPDEQPLANGPTVRVTSANLLHGTADPAALAAIVERRRPDVLALQEYNASYGLRLAAAGVFDELPHFARRKGGGRRDTAIASRWPIEAVEDSPLPDVYTLARITLPASPGQPAGRELPVVSAHPLPPIRPGNEGPWARWLSQLPGPQGALDGGIVAGDFNATLDHRQFRAVLDRGWRDAADQLGEGLRPTWQGGAGFTPTRSIRLTIDHVLVPPGAAVRGYDVDGLAGSDHRAITATVVLPAAR